MNEPEGFNTLSMNSVEVDSLYFTLANTTGNGDIFNESADEDYSKILDYGNPCPPGCPSKFLINCE